MTIEERAKQLQNVLFGMVSSRGEKKNYELIIRTLQAERDDMREQAANECSGGGDSRFWADRIRALK